MCHTKIVNTHCQQKGALKELIPEYIYRVMAAVNARKHVLLGYWVALHLLLYVHDLGVSPIYRPTSKIGMLAWQCMILVQSRIMPTQRRAIND